MSTEPGADPSAPGAGSTNDQLEKLQAQVNSLQVEINNKTKESDEWRSRFTGLQGKYQQEMTKWQGDSASLLEVREAMSQLSGLREQLEVQVSTLNEQLGTTAGEKEILEAQLERMSIVTKEFPGLVPFLQDDLLPDATGDELREKLKAMTERLKSMSDLQINEHLSGASPSGSPPSKPADSPSAILQEALKAMQSGDLTTYNDLYDQYLQKSKE